MKKYLSAALLPLIMIGCGSSSISGSIGTGYYVDSAVEGVSYTCGNQSGLTDVNGTFKFESGKECNFSINSHVFKTVAASALSDGVIIQEDNVTIARFLQTLDNDGDAGNGIKIENFVATVVDKVPANETDFDTLNSFLSGVTSYGGSPVSETEARAHLNLITPPPVTKWDGVPALETSGDNKLFVTSDETKLYIKVESVNDMSNMILFINSDNSAASGLVTGTWPDDGFDYRVTNDGLYKLENSQDFVGTLQQSLSYTITDGVFVIELDKSNFDYIAEKISVSAFFAPNDPNNIPENGTLNKFTDAYFNTVQIGRFSAREIGSTKDRVMVDTSKNLTWVNDNNFSKNACLAIHADVPEEYTTSQTFCSQLDYAGIGAGLWRDPTSAELSNFVKDTNAASIVTGYAAPCQRLIARDTDGEKAISTRFDTVKPLGEVSVLEQPLASNIGLRCVSDAVAPVADAGDDITVDFHAQFSFNASRSADSDGNIVTYEWIFGGGVLNQDTSTAIYTREATQPAGDYPVLLRVTDNDGLTDEDTVVVHVQ